MQLVEYAENTKRSTKSQALRDDEFIGGLEYNWLNMQKTRKRSKKSQALR
jgi:hypothetical protein